MSIRLCSDNIFRKNLFILKLLVTSILAANTLPLICSAAFTACCLFLEQTITVALLLSANSFDIAKPIPLLEPVTTATFPLSDDNYSSDNHWTICIYIVTLFHV